MTVLHLCHNETETPPLRTNVPETPPFLQFHLIYSERTAITPPAHHKPSRKDALTNRERILTAARETFAASSSASLSAIARQAGVGIGTLYRHFPSREALIVELYRHDIQHLIDLAPALLESTPQRPPRPSRPPLLTHTPAAGGPRPLVRGGPPLRAAQVRRRRGHPRGDQ